MCIYIYTNQVIEVFRCQFQVVLNFAGRFVIVKIPASTHQGSQSNRLIRTALGAVLTVIFIWWHSDKVSYNISFQMNMNVYIYIFYIHYITYSIYIYIHTQLQKKTTGNPSTMAASHHWPFPSWTPTPLVYFLKSMNCWKSMAFGLPTHPRKRRESILYIHIMYGYVYM